MQERVIEVKASTEPGGFVGILSTYGNVDDVGDVCERGCYDRTIAERGVKRPFLWQHDQTAPIGSLVITSSEDQLSVEGRFNLDVAKGREGYALLKAGDITGLSIGYIARDYSYDGDGIRHLTDVDLLEGSLVTIPANPLATAQAKAGRMERMSRYAKMASLKALTDEQRDAVLSELDSLKIGDVDEDGNEVVEVIDVDLPGEDEDEAKAESEEAEDKETEADETEDEIDEALKALADAVSKLKAKLKV